MPIDVAALAPPWDRARESLYQFIARHLDQDGSLGPQPPSLPDEVRDPSSVTWGAGTLEGISRHWGFDMADDEVVTMVIGALVKLARRPTPRRAKRLYDIVSSEQTLGYIDKVLGFLPSSGIDHHRLGQIGRWLATEAPDRAAVKFGMAVLGMVRPTNSEALLTLGAHDEFTLYAVVALANSGAGERGVFDLAKRVHGWGRIEAVERLADTADPEIKRWLLIEGYKNSVMYEYLALTCARTGDLLGALRSEPTDSLVDSAGELIEAMLVGQPGPPPSEYPDLVPAIGEYVGHISRREGTLADRRIVDAVRRSIGDLPVDATEAVRSAIAAAAEAFVARPHFAGLAEVGLLDPDISTYWAAKAAAADLGIDIYEAASTRISTDMDEHPAWFDLMGATDDDRIERTLELVRDRLDLDGLASGASTDMGLGPEYADDTALQWILQDLPRFPGHGWDLVRAGLQNRVIRNRNLAVRVLQQLPREDWPADAPAVLEAAIEAEVDDRVREFAADVLRGGVPVEDAWRRTVAQLEEKAQAELAALATALARTPQGRALRAEPSLRTFSIWDGAYDTSAHEHRSIIVGRNASGFYANVLEPRSNLEQPDSQGWSHDEAVANIAAMMNRLLTE